MIRDEKIDKNAATPKDTAHIALITATTQTNRTFLVERPGYRFYVDAVRTYALAEAGTVTVSGVVVSNGVGVIQAGALTVHSTPEQLALAASKYMIGGVVVEKGAATAITFSANHVVTANKFGIITIQINASGTVSSKVPASQQAYDTAAQALAATPAADSDKIAIATILIAADAGNWTANTDDLTNGSDLTSATLTTIAANAPFASAVAFAPLTLTTATLGAIATRKGLPGDSIVWTYTTDGSGALTNGQVTRVIRPYPLNGEL